jgi:hypothetical protein
MHGGPSPSAQKGNRNAFKHGRYTAEAIAVRKRIADLERDLREFAKEVRERRYGCFSVFEIKSRRSWCACLPGPQCTLSTLPAFSLLLT